MQKTLLAGVDFGTDSVRVLLCDSPSGEEISSAVSSYPRWKRKLYCDPGESRYRQHALDYLESFTEAFRTALEGAPSGAGDCLAAIAVDTTGSTPCPVDRSGTPLCLLERFRENPHAMFHLWKDHTALREAEEINRVFSGGDIDYTRYQGVYSSEWFWAKILHTMRFCPDIREAAYTWIEHSDWIAGHLLGLSSGERFFRGSCPAGHKALWHSRFGGLPDRRLLESLDSSLALVSDRYARPVTPAGTPLGKISAAWAESLGINRDTVITMGSFDAHAGAVGAGIAERTMVKVMGTSSVDLVIEKPEVLEGKDLREICGQAEDSIVPGYVGMEMGQPAFGDAYSWVRDLVLWPLKHHSFPREILTGEKKDALTTYLEKETIRLMEEEAEKYLPRRELTVDWFNGRRYPSLNESVRSVFTNISLGTELPALYCAVVKGTAFGSRRIFESLMDQGVRIERIIAVGGIAEKSPFILQMMADVLKKPLYLCRDSQVCARGAVIYAGVGSGEFRDIQDAQKRFCRHDDRPYVPDRQRGELFDRQYRDYLKAGELGEALSPQTHCREESQTGQVL